MLRVAYINRNKYFNMGDYYVMNKLVCDLKLAVKFVLLIIILCISTVYVIIGTVISLLNVLISDTSRTI